MNPYIMTILLFGLGLGTTITFASSHWLLAWMGLEINTLAIIPLMAQQHHPRAIEATTKYFLTQATAAATLLFASVTNAWLTGQWDIQQMVHPLPLTMITLAVALKIGLAPLHTWLPEVLQGLDLTTGLILSTWQKIAPFILLLQIAKTDQTMLVGLALTSTLVGGWGGLTNMLIIQFAPSLTLLALILYFVMTFSAFLTFKINNATSINMLAASWAKAPVITTTAPMILLSLGGLPPLTGFMPKWLILQEMTKQDLASTATIAALTALISLYFYLRLSYAMTLTMSPNNLTGTTPWRLTSKQLSLPLSTSIMMTATLLPLTPAVTSLLTL
uniref:NADH-ubiquinone oxidoreductase chain 2 n=1 Tax=Hypseleotris galii TaxID=150304 RepID=Q8M139_HYPGA|nr:NADH dehydrogenase subunit 2 [Hypseleotris galii]